MLRFRSQPPDDPETPDIKPIDVDALVQLGLHDRHSTPAACTVLTWKRKEIQHGLRVLDNQTDRPTPVKVRAIPAS